MKAWFYLATIVMLVETSSAGAQFEYTVDQIDQWIFQQDRNAQGARKRLDSHLTVQIDEIDRACKLTDPQKQKLRLAGRGDIKHFFDGYETIRRTFKPIKQNAPDFNDVWQKLWQDINPLQVSLQNGLFEENSLFEKSVRGTLAAEQRKGYDTLQNERRQFYHRIAVAQTIEMLDRQMRFTQQQRQKLTELLTKETKAGKPSSNVYYDRYYVLWQLGRLPEEKFRPLFDDVQVKFLDRQLIQAKGMAQSLRQMKVWPGDAEDEIEKPAAAKPARLKK